MKVGYLGPDTTTFGYMAAKKFFCNGTDIEFVPLGNHTKICQAACSGEVDFGVVAIENVIAGVVTETVRAMDKMHRSRQLVVCGEVELPIELFLFRKPGSGEPPKHLWAHPTAKEQCSKAVIAFLETNSIGNNNVHAAKSNGEAAQQAAQDDSCVALGTARAEEEYKLVRLQEESAGDNKLNFTRFWIVGRKEAQPTANDKTCLLINLDQPVPGGVSRVLAAFAAEGINMLLFAPINISGRKWEYTFLAEFAVSFLDPKMQTAYEVAGGIALDYPLVLGSYPAGTTK